MRMEPVTDASVWTGAELEADRSWECVLSDAHRAELGNALLAAKGKGLGIPDLTKETFPLPTLAPVLAGVSEGLRDGRGFALLRRFPVEDYDYDDIAVM